MTTCVVTCRQCDAKLRIPVAATGVPRCPRCHSYPAWIVAAGDYNFAQAIDASVPVLVDLWAPWCGPCRSIAPVIEALASELAGHVKVVKVNVDDAPEVAARYDARSIPTLLVMRDGSVIARQVGALSPGALAEWVRRSVS